MDLDTAEKYGEAITMFKKALEINPNDADIHFNIGETYKNWEKYENAIASYDRAIQLKCDYSNAFNSKGLNLKNLLMSK